MQAMQELDPSLTDQQAIDRMVAEFQDSRELFAYLEDQLAGLRMYSDVAELNAFGGSWHCRIGSQLLQRADQCPGRSVGGKGRSLLSAVRSNQPRQVRAPLRAARPSRPRTTPYQSAPSGQAMHLWRQHAERAVDILRHTTQIAGHHTHHDAFIESCEAAWTKPSHEAARRRRLSQAGSRQSEHPLRPALRRKCRTGSSPGGFGPPGLSWCAQHGLSLGGEQSRETASPLPADRGNG